jgi:hypothetical protein
MKYASITVRVGFLVQWTCSGVYRQKYDTFGVLNSTTSSITEIGIINSREYPTVALLGESKKKVDDPVLEAGSFWDT